MKKAVVVLPTYNEAGNIEQTINSIDLLASSIKNWQIDILVVDDFSPDGTAEVVKKLQKKHKHIHLISGKKEGLGKAYVRGFTYALEKLDPYVLFEMDADGQHDPKLIPAMLAKIENGSDFVVGARYIKGGSIPKSWGWERKMYSYLGNLIIQLGFMNFAVRDWTNGFRAIKAWVIKDILNEMSSYKGYVFQIALLDKALKKHAHVSAVPCRFTERTKGESKINALEYIISIILYILGNSSFIKFVIVGLIGFAVDFGFAYFFIHKLNMGKPIANSLSAEVAIISNFFFNNFWSFSHKQIKGGVMAYLSKLFFFNLVSSGSILIQGFGMFFALQAFGDKLIYFLGISLHSWILYKIFIIALIIIPYSYVMYNKVIWKKK